MLVPHVEVHDDDLWLVFAYKLHCLAETGNFCHHLDFRIASEQIRDPLPHDFTVFDQKHAYSHESFVLYRRLSVDCPAHGLTEVEAPRSVCRITYIATMPYGIKFGA